MGTDVSRDTYRVLVPQDYRLTYDNAFNAAESTVTQAGPMVGNAVPQQETFATLATSGTQSAGKALRVRAIRAGMTGYTGGSFAWRYGSEDWRGWDPPTTLSGWEAINYTSSVIREPHAITLTDHTVMVAYTLSSTVRIVHRAPTATAWTSVAVSTDMGAAGGTSPCLLQLPSGRVLCFWIYVGSEAQLRVASSDDAGATWTKAADDAFLTAIDLSGTVTVKRLRVAYLNGSIMAIVWAKDTSLTQDDILYQFASSDLGASFAYLERWSGADTSNHAAYPDLIATDREILLTYLRDDGTGLAAQPYIRRAGSAYTLMSGQDATLACQSANPMRWGVIAATSVTDGDLAAWRDEDGTLWMAGRDTADSMTGYTQRSTDNGATWAAIGSGSGAGYGTHWWNGRDAATYPKGMAGTHRMGQALVFHGFESTAATYDDSLCVAYLGGYTTRCLPPLKLYTTADWRGGWERTWLPFDPPEVTGGIWSRVPAGAVSTTITTGALTITGAVAGDSVTYTAATAPTSTLTQGLGVQAQVQVTTGVFRIYVRAANAVPESYEARIDIAANTITVVDIAAGGTYSNVTATTAAQTGVEVWVGIGNSATPADNGKLRVWYRAATTGGEADRSWTLIGDTDAMRMSAVANNAIQWGTASSGATNIAVERVQYTYGDNTGVLGAAMYTTPLNPTDLLGRPFSALPMYVDDGVKIAMRNGPAYTGDAWAIDTAYSHGVDRIFPDRSPCPRQTWRTTGETEQVVILDYAPTIDQNTYAMNGSMGVAVLNANVKTIEVSGYDDDLAAWTVLGTMDTTAGQNGLRFSRFGEMVTPYPPSGSAAAEAFTLNTLEDSYFEVSGDQGYVRRIVHNTGGVWAPSSNTAQKTRLLLEDVTAADGTGGAATACAIRSKDCLLIINGVSKYSKIKLRIPVQDTAEGFYEIGNVLIGPVIYLARQYSYGRVIEHASNTSLTTSRNGQRRSRVEGPMARRVRLAWEEGVDTSQVSADSPSPDYVVAYTGSTDAVGTPAATPFDVAGLSEYLRGPHRLMVYCPVVPKPADVATVANVVNRRNLIYGRMDGDPALTNVLGNEWENPGEIFTFEIAISEEA